MTTDLDSKLVIERDGVSVYEGFEDERYESEPVDMYQTDGVIEQAPARHGGTIMSVRTPDDLLQFNINDLPVPDDVSPSDHESILRCAIDNNLIQEANDGHENQKPD